MKVILVDDEPKAIALLASYLSHFSNFELTGTFRNGLKALEFLNSNEVDVVFLDINMPHLSGLSLSKMIKHETAIVFTTAYSEHALESYDVNTVDYLLKPISLERFSKTVTKLIDRMDNEKVSQGNKPVATHTIFIKSGLETHQLQVDTIDYLKKDGNYINYFMGEKKLMVRQSIAEALDGLTTDFIQIQKSYIVDFRKINSIALDHVNIGKTQIPIGLQFKNQLVKKMDR